MNSEQPRDLVTLSLFHFPKNQRWWAFSQMRKGPSRLEKVPGVRFSKMMGSGKGAGFSAKPNFSVYAILTVWDQPEALTAFQSTSYLHTYASHADEVFTILLKPVKVKGEWSGRQPFAIAGQAPETSVRGVLTRATIRKSRLWRFWQTVPATSRAIEQADGRIFSIGIGEWPWVQQATFSLWESENAIHQFAYQNLAHQEAIRKTKELNWYSEEMFARFEPVATVGSWKGLRLLEPYGISSFEAWPPPSELRAISSA